MQSNTQSAIVLAAFALAPLASAHGYVSGIVTGGEWFSGTSPEWSYANPKPDTAGWYAENSDNGFVAPSAFADPDIICHRGATVSTGVVPVAAGDTVDLQWNTWPESHKGPVITYMAAVDGEFASVDKEALNFFKIDAQGLNDGSTAPGKWATDDMMANNLTSTVTVPADLAPGNYVMRHEILALHSAGQADGAQSYPQCINFEVTGSGTASPCDAGAECAVGTALYTAEDPGVLVSIYQSLDSYTIPGPALYGGGGASASTSGSDVTGSSVTTGSASSGDVATSGTSSGGAASGGAASGGAASGGAASGGAASGGAASGGAPSGGAASGGSMFGNYRSAKEFCA